MRSVHKFFTSSYIIRRSSDNPGSIYSTLTLSQIYTCTRVFLRHRSENRWPNQRIISLRANTRLYVPPKTRHKHFLLSSQHLLLLLALSLSLSCAIFAAIKHRAGLLSFLLSIAGRGPIWPLISSPSMLPSLRRRRRRHGDRAGIARRVG